ncbi:YncE family protein [Alkalihalobacterium sp. APHAB7]|uniref:YncE family protein n=1 Tax=Alkalihalobacterium sp. APHAB7 TaxID=3402081 RepID=UPI003AAE4BC9
MKKKVVLAVLLFLFVLTGCQQLHLSLPDKQPLVMVTHLKDKKLSFIDLESYEVVYSEEFPFQIHSLETIGPNQVAIAGKLEDEVLLVDLHSGRIETLLEFGQGITSMNVDEKEQLLYITDAKEHQLHVYQLENKQKLVSIDVGSNPIQANLDENGEFIFVLSSGETPTVTVINRLNNEVELIFPVLELPTDLLYDGHYLWVAGHGHFTNWNESIEAYNPFTGEKVEEIHVGLMPIFIYDDMAGDHFYVLCHGSSDLYAIDRNTYEVKERVVVGDNPHYMSASLQHLFVTGLDGNVLSVIDRHTYEVVKEIKLAAGPFGVSIGAFENE